MNKNPEKPTRVAIIDLGTNTCNLLIVENSGQGQHTILFNDKYPVKMGRQGINNGVLTPDAIDRAMKALGECLVVYESLSADKIFAFATSAVRSAKNKDELLARVKNQFNITLQVITGDMEAQLIYKGVRASIKMTNKPVLIVDIGGGSNELIIANQDEIIWKRSYPVGMARVIEQFHLSEPAKKEEVMAIEAYFRQKLTSFFVAFEDIRPNTLLGASGAFDTFTDLLLASHNYSGQEPRGTSIHVGYGDFLQLHHILLQSTSADRMHMEGMDPARVEMIVPSAIFVHFLLKETGIKQIIHSNHSLKEGVLSELLSLG